MFNCELVEGRDLKEGKKSLLPCYFVVGNQSLQQLCEVGVVIMSVAEQETHSADVCGMSGLCLWGWFIDQVLNEVSAAGWDFKDHMAPSLSKGTDWQFMSPWLIPSLIDGGGHCLQGHTPPPSFL